MSTLFLFFLASLAQAEENFSVQVLGDGDMFADKGIALVDCISQKTGRSWQLDFDGKSIPRLEFHSTEAGSDDLPKIIWKGLKEEKTFLLNQDIESICGSISARSVTKNSFTPTESPDFPEQAPSFLQKKSTWALAAAIVAGSLLLWRHTQRPDHKQLSFTYSR